MKSIGISRMPTNSTSTTVVGILFVGKYLPTDPSIGKFTNIFSSLPTDTGVVLYLRIFIDYKLKVENKLISLNSLTRTIRR